MAPNPSAKKDPSVVNEEQASPDASSAGLCPGLTSNAVISQFLLLLMHQMRNSVIAVRVACCTHRQSSRMGDVAATHLWALESGMNLAFRPQSHTLLSASDRARAFPAQCPLDMARKPNYKAILPGQQQVFQRHPWPGPSSIRGAES